MNQNIFFSVIIILFSIIMLFFSFQLPPSETDDPLGPGGWPIFLLSFMLLLGLILLSREIIKKNKQNTNEKQAPVRVWLINRHWYVILALVVYFFLMPFLGFLVSTFIFVLMMTWLFNMKRKIFIFVSGLVSSIILTFIFMTLLHLPLPKGISIFYNLSLFFQ